jgi:long-chain acyl-CoA synthetase
MSKRWHKFYPETVLTDIEIPSISLYQLLERTTKDYPDLMAIIDGDKQWSYRQLKRHSDQFASALHKLGFRKGNRIAVMFPNSVEYVVAYFGIQRLGGVLVQVNPMYQQGELEYILEDSGARWFVGRYGEKEKLKRVPYCEGMKKILYTTEKVELKEQEYSFYRLINETAIDLPEVEIAPKVDIAVLQYTGGTTGKSKGAMLTHYNLIGNIYQSFTFSDGFFERPGERVLSISPFFHVYGMTSCMNMAIFAAGTIICLARFDVEKTLDLIRKYKPTFFPGVPTMYIALLHHPDSPSAGLQCFKVCNSGSAPMPLEVMKEFEQKTGASIIEGYGLSETSPVTHRNPVRGLKKAGSIGIPLPNTDSKIVDRETGEIELPPGEVGELIIKGPQVMKGYWNKPEETAMNLRDGWLYTGDLATMDEDGFFYIVGRKKDMIIAGGYNIFPVEVEDILYQHPAIEEVCVYGVPDSYRGETIMAAIVSRKGVHITEQEITQWSLERMARYKVPKKFEFRDSLPKTTVGKVLRRMLVEEAIEQMNSQNGETEEDSA